MACDASPSRSTHAQRLFSPEVAKQALDSLNMEELDSEDEELDLRVSANSIRNSRNSGVAANSSFQRWRASIRRGLRSQLFDSLIGAVIFLNSFVMVLEHSTPSGLDDVFEALEHAFLAIYLSELVARLATQGLGCFHDHWVVFDAVLVTGGVIGMWLLVPLSRAVDSATSSRVVPAMMVLRMLRLLRLVRTFRFLMRIRELWMLVQGLLSCASTMLYTFILCTLFIYMFASIGLHVIGRHELAVGPSLDPEFQWVAEEYFGSLTTTMITLIQFLCMDSIGEIYRPLIKKDWMLGIYFSAVILVMSIVLMNLITAVVVNAAFEQAAQDKKAQMHLKEKRRRRIAQELRRMFLDMDLDNSGCVCRSEITSASREVQSLLCHCMKVKSIEEVFDALDTDQDQELNIDEFCTGVMHVAASEAPIELHRIEKTLKHMRAQFNEFETVLGRMNNHAEIGFKVSTMAGTRSVGAESLKPSSVPTWAQQMIQELRELRSSLVSVEDEVLPELFQPKIKPSKKRKKMPPSLLLAAREVACVAGRVPPLPLPRPNQKDDDIPSAPFVLSHIHSTGQPN